MEIIFLSIYIFSCNSIERKYINTIFLIDKLHLILYSVMDNIWENVMYFVALNFVAQFIFTIRFLQKEGKDIEKKGYLEFYKQATGWWLTERWLKISRRFRLFMEGSVRGRLVLVSPSSTFSPGFLVFFPLCLSAVRGRTQNVENNTRARLISRLSGKRQSRVFAYRL